MICAICISDRGPFAQRPLGRNDAMVAVCHRCDGERAVEVNGRGDRSYESTGGMLKTEDVTAAGRKAFGQRWDRDHALEEAYGRRPAQTQDDGERAFVEVFLETHRRVRTSAARKAGAAIRDAAARDSRARRIK